MELDILERKEPKLRFKEFKNSEEWVEVELDKICNITKGKQLNTLDMVDDGKYYALNGGIEASGRTNEYNTNENTISISEGGNSCGYVNYNTEKFWCGSHCYTLNKLVGVETKYLYSYLKGKENDIMKLRKGTGIPNINKSAISKFKIMLTDDVEQRKIGEFFSLIDSKINLQNQKVDKLSEYKKGLLQKVMSQEIRFKDANGEDYLEWVECKIGDKLNYEQPTKYIVESTQYSDDKSLIPVLTANKSFILGYTDETDGVYNKGDVIIFDDFTMDLKYVNFKFKVKSGAMKMLTLSNNEENLKFYEILLRSLNLVAGNHKRYWISEVQNKILDIPCKEEQHKIGKLFESIDNKIEQEQQKLEKLKEYKKGLIQQMLI